MMSVTADIGRPPPSNASRLSLAEVTMGGTPIVLALVGLVFPIALILLAILFDLAVLVWALYRLAHDRIMPRMTHALRSHHWMPHVVHR